MKTGAHSDMSTSVTRPEDKDGESPTPDACNTHPRLANPQAGNTRRTSNGLEICTRRGDPLTSRPRLMDPSDCPRTRKLGRSMEGRDAGREDGFRYFPAQHLESHSGSTTLASCARTRERAPSNSQEGSVSHVAPSSPLPSPFRPPAREIRNRPIDVDKPLRLFILEDGSCGSDSFANVLNHDGTLRGLDQIASGDSRSRSNCAGAGIQAGGRAARDGREFSCEVGGGRALATAAPRRPAARPLPSDVAAGGTAAAPSPNEQALGFPVRGSSTSSSAAPEVNVPVPSFALYKSRSIQNAWGGGTSPANAGRKRPAAAAAASGRSGAGYMAPPPAPRTGAGLARERWRFSYAGVAKGSRVRSEHVCRGNDYDMDGEDSDFLRELNAANGCFGDGEGDQSWAVGCDLFESLMERLERQDTRERDVSLPMMFACNRSPKPRDFYFL